MPGRMEVANRSLSQQDPWIWRCRQHACICTGLCGAPSYRVFQLLSTMPGSRAGRETLHTTMLTVVPGHLPGPHYVKQIQSVFHKVQTKSVQHLLLLHWATCA